MYRMVAITILYTKLCTGGGGVQTLFGLSLPSSLGGNMNNMIKATAVLAILVAVVGCFVIAAEDSDADGTVVYVSASGDDSTGDGTKINPYATVKKAVETITSTGTVEVLSNFTMNTSDIVTIQKGQIITLDMDGKTATAANDFDGRYIINYGTLFIIGNGTFEDADSPNYKGPVTNNGTLTIKDGTFHGNTTTESALIWNEKDAKATFNGGTYEGAVTIINGYIDSETYINGGSYTTSWYPAIDNSGYMKITGGTFVNTSCSTCDEEHWGYTIRSGVYSSDAYLLIDEAEVGSISVTGVQGGVSIINGSAVINSGSFKTELCMNEEHTGEKESTFYALYVAPEKNHEVKATVNGGDFESAFRPAVRIGLDDDTDTSTVDAVVSILGGTFTSPSGKPSVSENANGGGDVTISGGTFQNRTSSGTISPDTSISSFLDPVCSVDPDTGAVAVDEKKVIATVGDGSYASLAEAVAAAQDGDEIRIVGYTAVVTAPLIIDKGVDIVFTGTSTQQISIYGNTTGPGIKFTSGSSSISGNGTVFDYRGYNGDSGFAAITVEGKDAKLTFSVKLQSYAPSSGTNGNTALEVSDSAELILDGATITEISYGGSGTNAGVGVFGPGESGKGNPTKLTICGDTTIKAGGFAVFGNGSTVDSGDSKDFRYTEIKIEGGSIISTGATAIYHPQLGSLTVTGGEITGPGAIELRAGSLKISGSPTITSTETTLTENTVSPGRGNSIYGAAIAISQHSTDFDIKVNISGGTFIGAYGFYEKDLMDDDSDNISASISNGVFIGIEGSVSSENMSGFVSGGEYLKGTVESNDPDSDLAETYLADNCILGDDGTIAEKVTISFDMPGDVQDFSVSIAKGAIVPSDEIPKASDGYTYTYTAGGSPWDQTAPVNADISVTVTNSLNPPTVDCNVSYDDELGATITIEASHPATSLDYLYSAVSPAGDSMSVSENGVYTNLPGIHKITVTVTDDDGLSATVTKDVLVSFEDQTTAGATVIDVMPGETSAEVSAGGLVFGFEDLQHGNLRVSVQVTESEDVPGYGMPSSSYEILVAGSAWTNGDTITISIPVNVPDGQRIVSDSVAVFFIPVESDPEDMNAVVGGDGSSIVFNTTHNSEYAVFYNLEAIPDDDQPFIPFPDDDDDYVPLPPHIVYEDDGSDDSVKIAACAAAAVIAAILAIVLATTYRRK